MTVAACAALVQRGDPDRFLAAMAAPVAAREVLFPLYAFNVEVSRAPWVTEEPMIAEMRLQWWRDALAEIAEGKPPRAHEVAAPLAQVIRARGLPVSLLDEAVAARRWDIYREPFEDAAHLDEYLDRTAGHLLWLSCLALGAGAGLERAARDAGRGAGIANWLRAVPELVARGRVPLLDGRAPALQALAGEGLARLRAARGAEFGPAVPAMRACWLAPAILRRALRDPGRVEAGALEPPEVVRRGTLVWKALRGGW